MRRFFMLIPEAVQLVLHAAAQAHSGATYVLEMGEQVKVLDMARDLIRLSGFVPDEEIPITFIGLRQGEKLYEELVGHDEDVAPSAVDKIQRVTARTPPREDFALSIARIESAAADGNREEVLSALRALAGLSADGDVAKPVEGPAPSRAGIRDFACCVRSNRRRAGRARLPGLSVEGAPPISRAYPVPNACAGTTRAGGCFAVQTANGAAG